MSKGVRKKLSSNDLGETGSHQAGILIPKEERILRFFPRLDEARKNPRQVLIMREEPSGERWEFNYIYYNNKFFGGTRNEYRLTGMTRYMRQVGAKVDDEIVISRDEQGSFLIRLARAGMNTPQKDVDAIILSGGWRVVI